MGEGVSRREFDRARDTIQPLLKSIRGIGLGRAPYHSVGSYHRCSIPSTSSRPSCQFVDNPLSSLPGVIHWISSEWDRYVPSQHLSHFVSHCLPDRTIPRLPSLVQTDLSAYATEPAQCRRGTLPGAAA